MSQETVIVDGIEVTIEVEDGEASIVSQEGEDVLDAKRAVVEHVIDGHNSFEVAEAEESPSLGDRPDGVVVRVEQTESVSDNVRANLTAAYTISDLYEDGWLVTSMAHRDEYVKLWLERVSEVDAYIK